MTDTELHAYAVIAWIAIAVAIVGLISVVMVEWAVNGKKYKRLMRDIFSIIVKAFKRPVETQKIPPECTVYTKKGKTITQVGRKVWTTQG